MRSFPSFASVERSCWVYPSTALGVGAFAEARRLHFPLLADFEPKGMVARQYSACRSKEGVSEGALFVVDKNGAICWSYCSPVAVNPGAEGILQAPEDLGK